MKFPGSMIMGCKTLEKVGSRPSLGEYTAPRCQDTI